MQHIKEGCGTIVRAERENNNEDALHAGGPPGVGKTQIGCVWYDIASDESLAGRCNGSGMTHCAACRMQLAVSVQLPREVGGLAAEAIYLGARPWPLWVCCGLMPP